MKDEKLLELRIIFLFFPAIGLLLMGVAYPQLHATHLRSWLLSVATFTIWRSNQVHRGSSY